MLVTRCPACSTAFKVVRDQLKLSHGWVRCGRCAHVFDASLYFFEASPPLASKATAPTAAATPQASPLATREPHPATGPNPGPEAHRVAAPAATSPATPAPGPTTPAPMSVHAAMAAAAPTAHLPAAASPPPRPEALGAAAPNAQPLLGSPIADKPLVARAMDEVLAAAGAPYSSSPKGSTGAVSTERRGESVSGSGHDRQPVTASAVPASARVDEPLELISRFPEEEAPTQRNAASVDIDALGSVRTPGAGARRRQAESSPPPPSTTSREASTERDLSAPDKAAAVRAPEPRFLIEARRRALWTSWPMRTLLTLLLLLGTAAATLQVGYWFRADLLRTSPALRPALEAICEALVCTIDAVERIEAIAIESSSMRLIGERSVELAAVLRSRERVDNRWPQLELSLTDGRDRLIARRVFDPQDYLPHSQASADASAIIDTAMKPLTEYAIRLRLDVDGAQPAGYRLAMFYR